tara:strand:+ start:4101 stop:4247 length:147 start_codon:yes stop_codon:yes gene_type:complete
MTERNDPLWSFLDAVYEAVYESEDEEEIVAEDFFEHFQSGVFFEDLEE